MALLCLAVVLLNILSYQSKSSTRCKPNKRRLNRRQPQLYLVEIQEPVALVPSLMSASNMHQVHLAKVLDTLDAMHNQH